MAFAESALTNFVSKAFYDGPALKWRQGKHIVTKIKE